MSYTLHITGSKADVVDLLQKLLSTVGFYNDELSAALSIRMGGVPQIPLEEILLSLRDHAESDDPHGVTAMRMDAPR